MKRLTTMLLAAALGAMLLLPASGGAQVPGATTLTFYEPDAEGTFKLIDNAPKSPTPNPESKRFRFSAGDELVISNPLYDRKGGTRQGALYITAKVMKGRTFRDVLLSAQATYVLTDGSQIAVQGVFSLSKPTTTVAVIGGSGRYAGARGSLASTSDATSSTDVLTLLP
jgi:hypothetical protein